MNTLPPPDRRLLRKLKYAQSFENYYVVIDVETMKAYSASGYYQVDAENAVATGKGIALGVSLALLDASIDYLRELGLLDYIAGPVYQVTHIGWYHPYIRRRELLHNVVTHVLFPSVVAFITALLTILLKG